MLDFLRVVEEVKAVQLPEEGSADVEIEKVCAYIRSHGLVREHIPTPFLNVKKVWSALNQNMPITALIRNLAKMTAIGLLDDAAEVKKVCDTLRNPGALHLRV